MPDFLNNALATRPRTWDRADHYLLALRQSLVQLITVLHDTISVATMQFWHGRGVRNLYLPITTSAVSSPMGLGSDSCPSRSSYLASGRTSPTPCQVHARVRMPPEPARRILRNAILPRRGPGLVRTSVSSSIVRRRYQVGSTAPSAAVEAYLVRLAQGLTQHADSIREFTGSTAHLERLATQSRRPPAGDV